MAHNVFAALQQFDNLTDVALSRCLHRRGPILVPELDQRIDVAEQAWQAW
jgi:hypothetical protein